MIEITRHVLLQYSERNVWLLPSAHHGVFLVHIAFGQLHSIAGIEGSAVG